MSKRDPSVLIRDMQLALERVLRYTEDCDFAAFQADTMRIDAVVRNLEIVGEAVRRLPEEFRQQHTQIPWHRIAGMRNRIVHDYFGIDDAIVWQVVQIDVPVLLEELRWLMG